MCTLAVSSAVAIMDTTLVNDIFLGYFEEECRKKFSKENCAGKRKRNDKVFPELKKFNLKPDFVCEEILWACDTDLYTKLSVKSF